MLLNSKYIFQSRLCAAELKVGCGEVHPGLYVDGHCDLSALCGQRLPAATHLPHLQPFGILGLSNLVFVYLQGHGRLPNVKLQFLFMAT